jgi:predicted methyltransferase
MMQQITLPDGLVLHIVSRVDAELEHRANAQHQVYFGPRYHHKDVVGIIRLHPGDTVLDVGANVGSFGRVAASAVGPAGRVVCLEPLPLPYKALQLNLQAYRSWAAGSGQEAPSLVALQAGGC